MKEDRKLLEITKEQREYLDWVFGGTHLPDPLNSGQYAVMEEILNWNFDCYSNYQSV